MRKFKITFQRLFFNCRRELEKNCKMDNMKFWNRIKNFREKLKNREWEIEDKKKITIHWR